LGFSSILRIEFEGAHGRGFYHQGIKFQQAPRLGPAVHHRQDGPNCARNSRVPTLWCSKEWENDCPIQPAAQYFSHLVRTRRNTSASERLASNHNFTIVYLYDSIAHAPCIVLLSPFCHCRCLFYDPPGSLPSRIPFACIRPVLRAEKWASKKCKTTRILPSLAK
jgi:hypothetical protein